MKDIFFKIRNVPFQSRQQCKLKTMYFAIKKPDLIGLLKGKINIHILLMRLIIITL